MGKSFFSNFNIFVWVLLDQIDLFESSEDITFCISNLSVGRKKRNFEFCFLGTHRNV